MSHVVGTIQNVNIQLGPQFSPPTNPPDTWIQTLVATVPPIGETKLVILHFANVSLPGTSRIEVDLGYGTDVFTSANGSDFWSRPVNVYAFAGGAVTIRYISSNPMVPVGGASIDKYGRGEQHHGELTPASISNCDPFFKTPAYVEPDYDPYWRCGTNFNWENAAAVPAGDIRATVAKSVGMIISVEKSEYTNIVELSSCSVTLIDTDKVISAGHCHQPEELVGSSVTFDYETDSNGNRILGYNPKFYKVKQALFQKYVVDGIDYSIIQLDEAPVGIPIIQMRHDIPAPNEEVFAIHHPNGAVKKLSIPHSSGFQRIISSSSAGIYVNFDVSGGSSGSGLFDKAGRIVGVLSNGGRCSLKYFPTGSILLDIAPAPPPAVTRDVMVVFDRSGSMSQNDSMGRTKIEAARDALSLFVQLIKPNVGNRLGLVSFSTQANSPVDFALTAVTPASKTTLVGVAPFSGGISGALNPGGSTSIGDGLEKARLQFPAPGANPRAILLMTDGMENTSPMIADVEGALNGIDIHTIGFGTESNIDGARLMNLVSAHNGKFTRAESGVGLEKFFSQAFGNIFEAGILMDPEYDLPANQPEGAIINFNVCGEEEITIVLGWDVPDASLLLKILTPSGVVIFGTTAGVTSATGKTWTFVKIPLPFNSERDGLWKVVPIRPGGGGEFPPPAPALHYFINVVPTGGAKLYRAVDSKRYYTGDSINPLVSIRYSDGTWPDSSKMKLVVTYPVSGAGNILSKSGMKAPASIDLDTIPARQATLDALEKEAGKPLITYAQQTFDMSSDATSTSSFEAAGVFGKPFNDLLKMEGHYQFHFIATYGDGCSVTRELLSSLYVQVSIDPSKTIVSVVDNGARSDGKHNIVFTITPCDQYGNKLGPGKKDEITVSAIPGTVPNSSVGDNGDGTYTITAVWDPSSSNQPGVIIAQPGKPGTIIQVPQAAQPHKWRYLLWIIILILLIIIFILIFFYHP